MTIARRPSPPKEPDLVDPGGVDPARVELAGDDAADLPPEVAAVAADEERSAAIALEPFDATPEGELPAPSERGVVLYDPLRRYLLEARRFKPLDAAEEHTLAVRYQQTGDREAAYRLVTAQLRLVVRIAFEFKRSWLNLLDLIQEGNVGLLLAVRKFDPYRGIRLSTYAAWWIRAYIIKFLLDNWRMVKVGTTNARRKLLFNLRKEKEALEAQGVHPSTRLLAERLDVSEEDVIEVDRSLGASDVSLDAPAGAETERTLIDTIPSGEIPVDEQAEANERREILHGKLEAFAATLDARDRAVFRDRMLADEPATLRALGERFGLTREGLRQVEKRIVDRLRQYLAAELPDLAALDLVPPKQLGPRPAESTPPKPARPRKPKRRSSS
jgi:RNA polymerase sigma-32 factor